MQWATHSALTEHLLTCQLKSQKLYHKTYQSGFTSHACASSFLANNA